MASGKVKNAASIDKLGELHSLLTEAHIARLKQDLEDNVFLDAATASAIAKFLADNGVFASPAEADDLAELREQFKERSRARREAKKVANGGSIVDLVKQDLEG